MVPAGTSTLAGMLARLGSVIARLTDSPPGGARVPKVIVMVPTPNVVRLSGFGVSVMMLAPEEMLTVAGLLLAYPSFTINCATNVPGRSTRNVGETPLAGKSIALLPGGLLVKDHE